MKLYSYYRSSCSYRVRIALNYKELSYEYLPIHLVKEGGEQLKESYLSLNPKGEVPCLVDQGYNMAQSVAIFLYLDRAHIGKPLFPKDFPRFEKCLELVEIINSGTQPVQNLAVLKKLEKDFSASKDQVKEWGRHFIFKGLQAFQDKVLEYHKSLSESGPYCMGEELSAADMFLIPQLYNARRFNVDLSPLEKLVEIEKNCLALECFKKAVPEVQPDAPAEV